MTLPYAFVDTTKLSRFSYQLPVDVHEIKLDDFIYSLLLDPLILLISEFFGASCNASKITARMIPLFLVKEEPVDKIIKWVKRIVLSCDSKRSAICSVV